MKYKAFDANSKVLGQAMLANFMFSDQEIILPIIKKNGLEHIQATEWYPLQSFLDVLSDMAETMDSTSLRLSYVEIGRKIIETTGFPWGNVFNSPREINDFIKSSAIPYYYHDNQGNVGEYYAEESSTDDVLHVVVDVPYPPDMFYGLIYAVAQIGRPTGYQFTVKYREDASHQNHENKTLIDLTWEKQS